VLPHVNKLLLSSRTKLFLYVKICSPCADLQPNRLTALIDTKDFLPDALYAQFKPRNLQLTSENF